MRKGSFISSRFSRWEPRRRRRPGLSAPALSFRAVHAVIAIAFLAAIALVWWSAITGRSGPLVRLAVAGLITEGVVVAANEGDCPLGPLQERAGDPVPLFELVLPPRAAKLAVPVLGGVAAAGIALLAARSAPAQPGSGGIASSISSSKRSTSVSRLSGISSSSIRSDLR